MTKVEQVKKMLKDKPKTQGTIYRHQGSTLVTNSFWDLTVGFEGEMIVFYGMRKQVPLTEEMVLEFDDSHCKIGVMDDGIYTEISFSIQAP